MDLKSLLRSSAGLIPTDRDVDSLSFLDPDNRYPEIDLTINDFINYQTCLLFSGPTRLVEAIKNQEMIKPAGLCINFSLQSEKQYTIWVELNSDEERHIPGRTRSSFQLGRVLSNHNSLLYAMYRWLTVALLTKEKQQNSNLGLSQVLPFIDAPGFATRQADSSYPADSAQAFNHNRANRHFNNLYSPMFHFPFGFLVVKLDGFMKMVDAIYIENCKIRIQNETIDQNPFILENAAVLCSKVKAANGLTIKTVQKGTYKLFTEQGGITNSSVNINDFVDINAVENNFA